MLLLVDGASLCITHASPAAFTLLGYAPDALIGMPIGDLECALSDMFFWDEMRDRSAAMVESTYRCADGSVMEVTKQVTRVSATPARFVVSVASAEKEQKTAHELLTMGSRLRATLEATADAIALIDDRGALRNMNRRFSLLWDIPQTLLLNRDDAGILAHIQAQIVAEVTDDTPGDSSSESDDVFETQYLQDGRVIERRTHAARAGDELIGHVHSYRDVTERYRTQEQLIAARDEATRASQAKRDFLATMSHEIRTPMNAILGMLSLLEKTPLSAQQDDYVGKSKGAAKALLGLINDILDLSKVEAGKMTLDPQALRLDQLMDDLSVILAAYVGGKPVEVLFDIDTPLPQVVVGDSQKLRQVLINLAGNAVKFTAAGEVVIQLRVSPVAPGTVKLDFSVRDTGIGIAEENQRHIFSGFSQAEASTTRKFGGTGLGLAISQRLVQIMGGHIVLSSTLGVGSTFSFSLEWPLVTEVPEELKAPLDHDSAVDGRPRRVLVVDDNATAAQLTAQMLTALGWHCEVAHSAQEAMQHVEAHDPASAFPFDAIYVDWHMPVLDGWETARRMRAAQRGFNGGQPVIVMLTSQNKDSLAQRSVQEQAWLNALLVKPLTPGMLRIAALGNNSEESRVQRAQQSRVNTRRLAGMKLLVVEDNLINQQIAEELLMSEGALVSMAANGQLGVDAVAAANPQFDAVLMDIQMPILDGYAATRLIREQLKLRDLPIIAMTANAMASDRENCLAAGMNEHVGKPFELNELVATLLKLSGYQPDARQVQLELLAIDSSPSTPGAIAESPASPVHARRATDGVGATHLANQPVIDVAGALARMSGLQSLYLRAAREYRNELQRVVPLFGEALSGDRSLAVMQMHTLKGTSATLGATQLAQEAARLEALCKDGSAGVDLNGEIAPLCALVNHTRAAMAAVISTMTGVEELYERAGEIEAPYPEVSAPFSALNHAEAFTLRTQLHELQALLEQEDFSALDKFADIRQTLGEHSGEVESLDQALQNLEFDAACAACVAYITQLDVLLATTPGADRGS